jgi:type III restriction enzyme
LGAGRQQLGHYGRWAFAEFADVFQMEEDFAAKVEAEFDRMIDSVFAK